MIRSDTKAVKVHEYKAARSEGHHQATAERYYDLVTDFYEFGWGRSFHMAPRRRGESFKASLLRHQHFLADRLALKPGMQVLDVGCGVGGPMDHLARYTGAHFVGLNINAYQIARARRHTRHHGDRCRFVHSDFMDMPMAGATFDGAFAIESAVHAPDLTGLYREVFRVLRPGARFAGYEWCMTEKYDAGNAEHRRIKQGILEGAGAVDIGGTSQVCDALRAAGYEVEEACDKAFESDPATPWYRSLQGRDFSLTSLPRIPMGRALINVTLRAGEALRLVPMGSVAVSSFLNATADAMIEGGQAGIFTPSFYFLARKPVPN